MPPGSAVLPRGMQQELVKVTYLGLEEYMRLNDQQFLLNSLGVPSLSQDINRSNVDRYVLPEEHLGSLGCGHSGLRGLNFAETRHEHILEMVSVLAIQVVANVMTQCAGMESGSRTSPSPSGMSYLIAGF